MAEHFADKVPDFKKDHIRRGENAPLTIPQEDEDDPKTMLPKFIPTQITPNEAHAIATEAMNAIQIPLRNTGMSDFQLAYLKRCLYDANQQMMLGQSVWQWQFRYEDAVARGEAPDPNAD